MAMSAASFCVGLCSNRTAVQQQQQQVHLGSLVTTSNRALLSLKWTSVLLHIQQTRLSVCKLLRRMHSMTAKQMAVAELGIPAGVQRKAFLTQRYQPK